MALSVSEGRRPGAEWDYLPCGIHVSRKAAPGDGAQILLYILGMAAWSPLAGVISASLSPIHLMTVAMEEVARGPVSGLELAVVVWGLEHTPFRDLPLWGPL